MYQFDVITLFPEIIKPYFKDTILKRAINNNIININFWNPRDFTTNKHKKVDDTPYGGGPGMVMSPQPLFDCIQAVKKQNNGPVIYLTPTGTTYTQTKAEKFSKLPVQKTIIICGRYEGIDQRVIDLCVDEQISIGAYILSGGEIGALVLIESITRLLPQALGNENSHLEDSFSKKLMRKKKHPVYTKPATFLNLTVPSELLSGDHAKIAKWKNKHLK